MQAQQVRVDPSQMHERAIIVVPMTGSGTYADPIRPLLSPTAAEMKGESPILSWTWQPSDDRRFAIVEVVTRDKAALETYIEDKRVVKAFERGKSKREDVERELKVFRRDFDSIRREEKRP
jgi:hypothetical protein